MVMRRDNCAAFVEITILGFVSLFTLVQLRPCSICVRWIRWAWAEVWGSNSQRPPLLVRWAVGLRAPLGPLAVEGSRRACLPSTPLHPDHQPEPFLGWGRSPAEATLGSIRCHRWTRSSRVSACTWSGCLIWGLFMVCSAFCCCLDATLVFLEKSSLCTWMPYLNPRYQHTTHCSFSTPTHSTAHYPSFTLPHPILSLSSLCPPPHQCLPAVSDTYSQINPWHLGFHPTISCIL